IRRRRGGSGTARPKEVWGMSLRGSPGIFPNSLYLLLVSFFGSLVLCGAQCDTTIQTVELQAAGLATIQELSGNDEWSHSYCGGNPPYADELLFPKSIEQGFARVGSFRAFDNGTQPFPCPWWFERLERGLVRFDVASLGAVAADRI